MMDIASYGSPMLSNMGGTYAQLMGPQRALVGTVISYHLEGVNDRNLCRVKIFGPHDEMVPCDVKQEDDNTVCAYFTGTIPGVYRIMADVAGRPLINSPAHCELQTSGPIQCEMLNRTGHLGEQFVLLISMTQLASAAPQGGLNRPIVTCDARQGLRGRQEPCTVLSLTPANTKRNAPTTYQWQVLVRPDQTGQFSLTPKINDCMIPGSPFYFYVVDYTDIKVSGPGLRSAAVGDDIWFRVHLPEDTPESDCQTVVIQPPPLADNMRFPGGGSVYTPGGNTLKKQRSRITSGGGTAQRSANKKRNNLMDVQPSMLEVHRSATEDSGRREFLCQYRPTRIGPHEIHVSYLGRPVPKSPWICHVFDANKVRIFDVPQRGSVGIPAEFRVDCREAGRGDLHSEVSVNGSLQTLPVRAKPEDESQHVIKCSFIPRESGEHIVHVKFNGIRAPESPFMVIVPNRDELIVPRVIPTQEIISRPRENQATVITQPLRVGVPSELRIINRPAFDRQDELRVQAFTSGKRPSDLRPADHREGYSAFIKDPYGEELPHRIMVSSSTDAQLVEFTPRRTGEHQITVQHFNSPVEGSPFLVRVYDPSKVKVLCKPIVDVGKEAQIRIETIDAGHVALDVSVDPPLGYSDMDTHLRPTEGGSSMQYWVFGYTPDVPGVYRIHVLYGDAPIKGSPFEQHAIENGTRGIYEEGRIPNGPIRPPNVYGDGITRAIVGQKAKFSVDPHGRKGDLFVQVDGPSSPARCHVERDLQDPSIYHVEYVPTEVGEYFVRMKFNDQPVIGSPFRALVVAPETIRCVSDPGVHMHEVLQIKTNQRRDLVFECSLAGPGRLSAEVLDSTQLDVPCEVYTSSNHIGSRNQWNVSFIPRTSGRHRINVWWEGIRLHDCPILADTEPLLVKEQAYKATHAPPEKYTKVVLMGHGIRECTAGMPAEFFIDGYAAGPGKPRAILKDSNSFELPVRIEPEDDQHYTCTYITNREGPHQLHIWWDDTPIRGSPFTVYSHAGAPDPGTFLSVPPPLPHYVPSTTSSVSYQSPRTSDSPPIRPTYVTSKQKSMAPIISPPPRLLSSPSPSRQTSGIRVWGDGLRTATVGQKAIVFVDLSEVRNASGLLSAQCNSPRGVPIQCRVTAANSPGTYELSYIPTESGPHELFIYHDGTVLRHCPYHVRVSGSPDPMKVRVYGPGIEWGVLDTFESRFVCDTKGAGAGQLTVKIKGRQGAFRVELEREAQHDRTILCRYDPSESGDYYISVKWSGEHVPGSPFHVKIFRSAREMQAHMKQASPQR